MKISFCSVLAVASLCFVPFAVSADQSQSLPTLDIKRLPAAVQMTLESEGARVREVQRATDRGPMIYEATVSKGGEYYSLLITKDGTILGREAIEQSGHRLDIPAEVASGRGPKR